MLMSRMASLLKTAISNKEKAQIKQNTNYDKHRSDIQFELNDLVLIKTHALSKAAIRYSQSLEDRYKGPYVIIKKVSSNAYEIAKPITLQKMRLYIPTDKPAGWPIADIDDDNEENLAAPSQSINIAISDKKSATPQHMGDNKDTVPVQSSTKVLWNPLGCKIKVIISVKTLRKRRIDVTRKMANCEIQSKDWIRQNVQLLTLLDPLQTDLSIKDFLLSNQLMMADREANLINCPVCSGLEQGVNVHTGFRLTCANCLGDGKVNQLLPLIRQFRMFGASANEPRKTLKRIDELYHDNRDCRAKKIRKLLEDSSAPEARGHILASLPLPPLAPYRDLRRKPAQPSNTSYGMSFSANKAQKNARQSEQYSAPKVPLNEEEVARRIAAHPKCSKKTVHVQLHKENKVALNAARIAKKYPEGRKVAELIEKIKKAKVTDATKIAESQPEIQAKLK
uniref:Uncharacterized protein n=1 Tax=Strigamia maritima TaxID=126957 RepID=T1IKH3_STRMM